jgi:hypothetical protein
MGPAPAGGINTGVLSLSLAELAPSEAEGLGIKPNDAWQVAEKRRPPSNPLPYPPDLLPPLRHVPEDLGLTVRGEGVGGEAGGRFFCSLLERMAGFDPSFHSHRPGVLPGGQAGSAHLVLGHGLWEKRGGRSGLRPSSAWRRCRASRPHAGYEEIPCHKEEEPGER